MWHFHHHCLLGRKFILFSPIFPHMLRDAREMQEARELLESPGNLQHIVLIYGACAAAFKTNAFFNVC